MTAVEQAKLYAEYRARALGWLGMSCGAVKLRRQKALALLKRKWESF